jgi:hypothetical protein
LESKHKNFTGPLQIKVTVKKYLTSGAIQSPFFIFISYFILFYFFAFLLHLFSSLASCPFAVLRVNQIRTLLVNKYVTDLALHPSIFLGLRSASSYLLCEPPRHIYCMFPRALAQCYRRQFTMITFKIMKK